MPSKKGKKEKKGLRALYVGVESINDLARNMAGEKSYIIAIKSGSAYKLMCEGDRIGDGRIIYHAESKSIGRYLVYGADEESGEKVEFADDVTQRSDHYKSQRIPIMEIEKDPYSTMEDDDLKEIKTVEAKDPSSLVRSLINSMGEEEAPKLYSFAAGKERIIGTMFLLGGHDKVFTCARVAAKGTFSTISYDYSTDLIEYTNSVGGTSKINIRVINLAEQPPFFKG